MATGQVTVQVVIFLAVALHKVSFNLKGASLHLIMPNLRSFLPPPLQAPAAFGLVSFLMHSGLDRRYIQGHLLAFSAAAPTVAIITYFILHAVR